MEQVWFKSLVGEYYNSIDQIVQCRIIYTYIPCYELFGSSHGHFMCSEVDCAKQQPEAAWAQKLLGLKEVPEEFEPQRKLQSSLASFMGAMNSAIGGRIGLMVSLHP